MFNYLKFKELFLIQCYTGLSYSDTQGKTQYSIKEIEGIKYIIGNRKKNQISYCTPIKKRVIKILEKYNYKLPVISNQKYNTYLNEIMEIVGIEKHITTHAGRRTFAQMKLDFGYSLESVSKMLGHTSTKTTITHYCNLSFELVHKEAKKYNVNAA